VKRDRIEGERQRNIDLVIKYVISEEDAKQRITELKEGRLRVEAELAALDEAPVPIALHPATLDRYTETVNALAEAMAGHADAEDDRRVPSAQLRRRSFCSALATSFFAQLASVRSGDPIDPRFRGGHLPGVNHDPANSRRTIKLHR
jgi:hypothetical protein